MITGAPGRSTRRHSRSTRTGSARKKNTTDIASALNVFLANGRFSAAAQTTAAPFSPAHEAVAAEQKAASPAAFKRQVPHAHSV
jgi:hypothetical protein